MADNQSVDIMASVFENIVLPNVEVEELGDQHLQTAPVPKKRHDVPLLEKEHEFRASFIHSEPVESSKRTSIAQSTEIHEPNIIYRPEPIDHQVHLEEIHYVEYSPQEIDHVGLSNKLPKHDADQVIAELKSRHVVSDHDNGTLTTSKTSEICHEYDLYSKNENIEVNEQTDDSGTETEEVLPVNRTKYLFDTKDLLYIEHDKQPDMFQQELGQKIAERNAPRDTVKSNVSGKTDGSDFIVSFFENNQGRIRTDIKLQNLKQAFESSHSDAISTEVKQNKVQDQILNEVRLEHLRQVFESSNLDPIFTEVKLNKLHDEQKKSYKEFLGRKSPEHKILRSESIISTNVLPIESLKNESEILLKLQDHVDGNANIKRTKHRHVYSGEKPNLYNVQNMNKEVSHVNRHIDVKPTEITARPIPSYRKFVQSQVEGHHDYVKYTESPVISRRSTQIDSSAYRNQLKHAEQDVIVNGQSYHKFIQPQLEGHRDYVKYTESPLVSRQSTQIDVSSDQHHGKLAKITERPIPSYRKFVQSQVEGHRDHIKYTESPLVSRQSTQIDASAYRNQLKYPGSLVISRRSTQNEVPDEAENHRHSYREYVPQEVKSHHQIKYTESPVISRRSTQMDISDYRNQLKNPKLEVISRRSTQNDAESHGQSYRKYVPHLIEERRDNIKHVEPIQHELQIQHGHLKHSEPIQVDFQSYRNNLRHVGSPIVSRRSTQINASDHHLNLEYINPVQIELQNHHEHLKHVEPIQVELQSHHGHSKHIESSIVSQRSTQNEVSAHNSYLKHSEPIQVSTHHELKHKELIQSHQHHNDINNNVEHGNVAKLCTIFERNYHFHPKDKRLVSESASPIHNLEKYYVPIFSRTVISDDIAEGRGSATPGSIAALHKSILTGNPIIRSITPMSYYSVVEEDYEEIPHREEIVIREIKKHRKPKTLSSFYERWGHAKNF